MLWSNKIVPFNDETQKGKPPEPKKLDLGKLAVNVLAGVAVVAVVAAVGFFTFGMSVAVTAAVMGGIGILSVVASDIQRGEVSDLGTYLKVAAVESIVGLVCGAAFGPIFEAIPLGSSISPLLEPTAKEFAFGCIATMVAGGGFNASCYNLSEVCYGRTPTLEGTIKAFEHGVMFTGGAMVVSKFIPPALGKVNDFLKGSSPATESVAAETSAIQMTGEARKLDSAKDADSILDVKSIRQSVPSRYKTSGNLATAEVNVDGISQNKFFAHSSIDKMHDNLVGKVDNISLQPENPMFKSIKAANKNGDIYLRDSCTEYKILNDIANRLKDNVDASGKIKLVTELKPCDSCKNLIENFRSIFKNIEIEVIHNDDIRIIPKNGY